MLLFEQAVERVKIETGQLLIPFESLKLTDDHLEKMFVNTVRKLQNKRPIRAVMSANVDPVGIKIPDALGVLACKYKLYDNFDRVSPPISRSYWFFDPTTKILRSLFACPFIITYLKEFSVGHFKQTELATTTVDNESEVDFFIKGSYKTGTLELSKTHYGTNIKTTMTEVSRTSTTASLSGTLGTGTVDLKTLKIHVDLTDRTGGDITAIYYNKRKAILDLDEYNLPFYMWFTVDVLRSIGSLKAQATMSENTGLPFSLQADTLLERARVLEDQLQEQLKNNNAWWQWGF